MKIIEEENKWDKKIRLEVSLLELQMIYDCIGVTAFATIHNEYEANNTMMKYKVENMDVLYRECFEILSEEGGIVFNE